MLGGMFHSVGVEASKSEKLAFEVLLIFVQTKVAGDDFDESTSRLAHPRSRSVWALHEV